MFSPNKQKLCLLGQEDGETCCCGAEAIIMVFRQGATKR